MKTKPLAFGLWMAALLPFTGGCLFTDASKWTPKEQPAAAPPAVQTARPAAPVTADQVSSTNARDKVKALLEEIDRDGQGEGKP